MADFASGIGGTIVDDDTIEFFGMGRVVFLNIFVNAENVFLFVVSGDDEYGSHMNIIT